MKGLKTESNVLIKVYDKNKNLKHIIQGHNTVLPRMFQREVLYSHSTRVSERVDSYEIVFSDESATTIETTINQEGNYWIEWYGQYMNTNPMPQTIVQLFLENREVGGIPVPYCQYDCEITLMPGEFIDIFWKVNWQKATGEDRIQDLYLDRMKNYFRNDIQTTPFTQLRAILDTGGQQIPFIANLTLVEKGDQYLKLRGHVKNTQANGTLVHIDWGGDFAGTPYIYVSADTNETWNYNTTKRIDLTISIS